MLEQSWVKKELSLTDPLKKGDNSPEVKKLQEWLTLNGLGLAIDGDFGPATRRALEEYQKREGLEPTGVAKQEVFARLTQGMARAVSLESCDPVEIALAHLAQSPREVGGQNRGPWVRLYMEGREGDQWPWCAGFVFFALRQASLCAIAPTFSCDEFARRAKSLNRFIPEADAPGRIQPGFAFLVRKGPFHWSHTGLVTRVVDHQTFETVEGNTNNEGDREGYEVCRRIRSFGGKDFVNTLEGR